MKSTAYQQVYESLSKKIVSGSYPIGSLLPSEPALEKIYKVSRITIRRAVDMLTINGFVKKQQGIGTIVLDYCATQNLNRITSFVQTLENSGYVVEYKKCEITTMEADEKLSDILQIPVGSKVARIHRVVLASGVTIAIINNYIAYDNVPEIEKFVNKFSSLYKLLEDQYFIKFDISQDSLSARAADESLAEELNVPVGFPILCDKRKALFKGKCLSYDTSFSRGDMHSFNITLFN